jgi:hypothetical protein
MRNIGFSDRILRSPPRRPGRRMIGRRKLIALLGGTILAPPSGVRAQQPLLIEVVPRVRQIGMLRVLIPWRAARLSMLRAATGRRADAPTIDAFPVHDATEVPSTLDAIKQAKPDALVVDNDVTLVSKAPEIAAIGLVAISSSRNFTDARAADQVRSRDQPENRQRARAHLPPILFAQADEIIQ